MGLFQKLWGNRPSKSTAAAASYFRTLTGYSPTGTGAYTNRHLYGLPLMSGQGTFPS